MKSDSDLWRKLRIGDRIRLVEIPPEFLRKGHGIHRDTLRVYKRLLARRRPLRVCKVDERGAPWIACRFRRADGRLEHHRLAVNHGGLALVHPKQIEGRDINFFTIRASGELFDVDRYLKRFPLTVDEIWRRGEHHAISDTLYQTSGFQIHLGSGVELETEDQQAIAIAFLEANLVALRKLGAAPGVSSFFLGLQETVYPNSAGSVMFVSPTLMKLAVKVGIQLSIAACLNRAPFPM